MGTAFKKNTRGLDPGTEPPLINLCTVPLPPSGALNVTGQIALGALRDEDEHSVHDTFEGCFDVTPTGAEQSKIKFASPQRLDLTDNQYSPFVSSCNLYAQKSR